MNAIQEFDKALNSGKITSQRGPDYGHPSDNFSYAAALEKPLEKMQPPTLQHCAKMIVFKLARLITNPWHVDSWIDIAGYARCACMIIDKEPGRITYVQE